VALLAAGGLVLSLVGCGARVAPYFPPSAAAAGSGSATTVPGGATGFTATTLKGSSANPGGSSSTGGGGSTGGSGGSAVKSGGSTGGGSSSSGSGSKGSGTATAAALTPATFNLNPQYEASYCTGTAGNTASAPGVTPTTITVGNVSGLTGVVSDSFSQSYQAVTALFDSINRFGGICGRQLKIQVEDDQQSASTNSSDVQFLIPKVLAFVGSMSDADNGGVPAMVAAGVPDIGPAINTNRSNSSVYWSATGGSVTVKGGQAYLDNAALNGLRAYGDLPSSIAILSYSIPISAEAGEEYATLYQKFGVKICYSNYSIPPAPGTEMGSVVQAMSSDHCGGVFTTMDIVGNADMLDDMHNDGFHPPLISTTYEGYTPDQISLAGEADAQDLQVGLSSVPLTDANPAVQLYQSELATYEPNQAPSEFGLEGWADAQLFVYALIHGGRNPTRASLANAMASVKNWTVGGAFGPYSPSTRTGPLCADMVEVHGNAFTRLWPSSGLYCNGTFVDVGSPG